MLPQAVTDLTVLALERVAGCFCANRYQVTAVAIHAPDGSKSSVSNTATVLTPAHS